MANRYTAKRFLEDLAKLKGKFLVSSDGGCIRTKARYTVDDEQNQLCPIEAVYKNRGKEAMRFTVAATELGLAEKVKDSIVLAADNFTTTKTTKKLRVQILEVLGLKEVKKSD